MKRILCLLATTAVIALTSTAVHAADLAAKAYMPPPPPPAPSWTGFYLGINGGFGGDRNQYPFTVGGVSGTSSLNSSGFFGGGQIGYNWQFAPAWVAGVEGDIDAADIQGMASTTLPGASSSIGTRLDWFGTVRGRIGYLVTPNTLFYGTGGWAYGHTTSSASAAVTGLAAGASVGKDMNGWTAGAGLEYALTPWMSFKTEYLFVDLGSATLSSGVAAGVPFSLTEKTTAHTVRAGINVKLGNWGGGWGL
ncbi:MAG TPA: outer membrane beta-barrel protein [Xanthobacteraceae bacterium]|nr:outer membrane beta-barrel protein [Xanthobacteraceae bacterium]